MNINKICSIKNWNIKQRKLNLSSFDQFCKHFSLVSGERNILSVEVSISSLYLSQQPTLRMFAKTKQTPNTHFIGKQGEQQGILTIPFEVFKAFP